MSEVQETTRPTFYTEPVENKVRSKEENRPIFEDRRFVKLVQPGDRLWSFIEEITADGVGVSTNENYALRFPRYWEAFKRGEERTTVGTPLSQTSIVSRARAEELKYQGVYTVEEYANVQDNVLSKIGMGAREEREKCRAYLDQAKGGADIMKMATQMADMQATIERLTMMMNKPNQVLSEDPTPIITGEIRDEKPLEECTDDELKAYIKRETGKGVPGQPSRETLLAKAAEIAKAA